MGKMRFYHAILFAYTQIFPFHTQTSPLSRLRERGIVRSGILKEFARRIICVHFAHKFTLKIVIPNCKAFSAIDYIFPLGNML